MVTFPTKPTATINQANAEFMKWVGYREGRMNANRFSADLGRPPEAWCSDFVVDVNRMAGVVEPNSACRSAYTPTAEAGYKKAGRLHSTPKPGDTGFVYSPSAGRIIHRVRVYAVSRDGKWVYTVEGNTNDDGSANGIGVFKRKRPAHRSPGYSGIRSYGRPLYRKATPNDPKPHRANNNKDTIRVKALQHLLELGVDGQWGPNTDEWALRMRTACRAHLASPKVKHPFKEYEVQKVIDVTPDDVWGPKSQAALTKWLKQLQNLLGVKADGEWGAKTDAAFRAFRKNNLNNY
jgi:hypothetical protein